MNTAYIIKEVKRYVKACGLELTKDLVLDTILENVDNADKYNWDSEVNSIYAEVEFQIALNI